VPIDSPRNDLIGKPRVVRMIFIVYLGEDHALGFLAYRLFLGAVDFQLNLSQADGFGASNISARENYPRA
jgi:hypothetical protein